jgi:hypothetical protein
VCVGGLLETVRVGSAMFMCGFGDRFVCAGGLSTFGLLLWVCDACFVCVCVCMYVCMYASMHACMHVCMLACDHGRVMPALYVCMYVCMY